MNIMVQGCTKPPARKMVGQIEKETLKKRITNIECRSNVFCLFFKKELSEAIPSFAIRHSSLAIPYSL